MDLAKSVSVCSEIVGIAGCGAVAHVSEFTLGALGAHVEKFGGDSGIENQVPVKQSEIVLRCEGRKWRTGLHLLDPLGCFIPPRDTLRDPPIPNVSLRSVIPHTLLIPARDMRHSITARTPVPPQQRNITRIFIHNTIVIKFIRRTWVEGRVAWACVH